MDQNFVIGYQYFLKKRRLIKLPVRTKILLFVAVIFLFVIFLLVAPVFCCAGGGALGLLL